jgi:hypothetical protein
MFSKPDCWNLTLPGHPDNGLGVEAKIVRGVYRGEQRLPLSLSITVCCSRHIHVD